MKFCHDKYTDQVKRTTGPTFPRNLIVLKWCSRDWITQTSWLIPTSRLAAATNVYDPIRLVLSSKDHASAGIVRTQLNDLSQKIDKTIQPVFVSQKINQHLKLSEAKLLLVNQQAHDY